MLPPPMRTIIPSGDSDWSEITRIYLGHQASNLGLLAGVKRRLQNRHDVPGVEVHVDFGVIEVSHPGGIAGLESGWEMIGEHA